MSKSPEPVKTPSLSDRQKDIIQKFAALGSLVVLAIVFSATSSAFFSVNNAMTIALQVTSIALLGIGATCVIITAASTCPLVRFWHWPALSQRWR